MQEHLPEESEHCNPICARSCRKAQVYDVPPLLETAKILAKDSDLRVFHRFDKLRVFYISVPNSMKIFKKYVLFDD
jgi:hypothetical protein